MPKALRPFPQQSWRGSYAWVYFCCARARDVFCTDLVIARHFYSYLPKNDILQQMWHRGSHDDSRHMRQIQKDYEEARHSAEAIESSASRHVRRHSKPR